MPLILHCTRRLDWDLAVAQGSYTAPSLKKSGFIHFSTPEQLLPVVNALFHGQSGLVLLCVESDRLTAQLRYENLDGGTPLFPHVYGPVNLDAVDRVLDFPPEPDGSFHLPPSVSHPPRPSSPTQQ